MDQSFRSCYFVNVSTLQRLHIQSGEGSCWFLRSLIIIISKMYGVREMMLLLLAFSKVMFLRNHETKRVANDFFSLCMGKWFFRKSISLWMIKWPSILFQQVRVKPPVGDCGVSTFLPQDAMPKAIFPRCTRQGWQCGSQFFRFVSIFFSL